VNGLLRRLRRNAGQLLFERRYGVRTAGTVNLEELGLAAEDRVYYSPSSWRALRRTLRRNEITDSDVFLDLGSGMGRMVLAAARYPFRRVIGVELAEELHEIARDNVAHTRLRLRCDDIELVRSDALAYRIPDDVTVVYMNNPFRGPVFTAVIGNLIASVDAHPRPVRLIYFNPAEARFLQETGRFRHLRTIAQPRHKPGSVFGLTSVYQLTTAHIP